MNRFIGLLKLLSEKPRLTSDKSQNIRPGRKSFAYPAELRKREDGQNLKRHKWRDSCVPLPDKIGLHCIMTAKQYNQTVQNLKRFTGKPV
jgi:hypothetical protein